MTMTRTIEIDEDVYQHILSNTVEIGEGATSILRRLLGLARGAGGEPAEPESEKPDTPLSAFLNSADFRRHRNVKDRFLAILGQLHRDAGTDFAAVLEVQGRKRIYFARTPEKIANSGTSVAPGRIPDSPYWVTTNTSTSYKQTILRRVMVTLGYDDPTIREALRALSR